MIDATELIAAMHAYRKKLLAAGQPLKAAAVTYCITMVRRLAK